MPGYLFSALPAVETAGALQPRKVVNSPHQLSCLICGPKDRKPWAQTPQLSDVMVLPLLAVVRVFSELMTPAQWERKVLCFVHTCRSLGKPLGLLVGTESAPVESPPVTVHQPRFFLASGCGAKGSSEPHLCGVGYLQVWVQLLG